MDQDFAILKLYDLGVESDATPAGIHLKTIDVGTLRVLLSA